MSISFTPSQVLILARIPDAVRVSYTYSAMENASFFDLQQMYSYENPVNLKRFTKAITGASTEDEVAEANSRLLYQLSEAICVVAVKLRVFDAEFNSYSEGQCKLSDVRKAHRQLIDSLAPFHG